ncbi:NAD(P)/FAD-dependent oxidoreductase [Nonlabens antarcticus]|uniref:NAD(P)/FAD-dependent oxidoreductase n=1 Tax=Nonlabens antarcticus TaxID=392714 RepID=UPI0018914791|nr:NAD(P)/FAD-dependent oxidoreductase [Nonlabens antarcticus]
MKYDYDIIIAGGGLSGLWAAIELGDSYKVLLLDPSAYPRHKMCGEYLSAEIKDLLQSKGIVLDKLTDAYINHFQITLQNGKEIDSKLPLGGYGISRHCLDFELFKRASQSCSILKERVKEIYDDDPFQTVITTKNRYTCKQVIVATGKRSQLDRQLQRDFMKRKSEWLAVKMHYKYEMPLNKVELHNFDGGYAGLSKTETGAVNLCYLTSYRSFKKYKDVDLFQKEVLSGNPQLKAFFKTAQPLWEKPMTISQISFGIKKQGGSKLLFIGDSAGLIHPLCGNGMAMAIHSAHLAAINLEGFMQEKITRLQMIKNYRKHWRRFFQSRMRFGQWIQNILIHPHLTKVMYGLIARLPSIMPRIIKKTHGKPVKY